MASYITWRFLRQFAPMIAATTYILVAGAEAARALPSTVTALQSTVSGRAANYTTAPDAVTLTATVTASGSPVKPGQVKFCDASINTRCEGLAFLGTSQLMSNGKAILVKRFGFGPHSLQVFFLGTKSYAASQSSAETFTQEWKPGASFSHITSKPGGTSGTYDLTATLTGLAWVADPPAPSGTVSFLDTSNGDSTVSTGTLVASTAAPYPYLNDVFQPLTGRNPTGLAVADLNGDGIPDFAVANASDNSVSIFLGQGNGDSVLAETVNLSSLGGGAGQYPVLSIRAADFNSDGNIDLVISDNASTLSVLLGNGNGTFQAPITTDASFTLWAVGDFNGDGIPDLAVLGSPLSSGESALRVELGNGDGTFTDHLVYSSTGVPLIAVSAGDINNDGIQDLVVTNLPVSSNNNDTLLTFLGNGDGTFQTPHSHFFDFGSRPCQYCGFGEQSQAVLADLTGDGNLDIVVPGGILLGNGDGTFQNWIDGMFASSLAVVDINGDGIPDVIGVNNQTYAPMVQIGIGRGDGTFRSYGGPAVPNSAQYFSILTTDLTGTGKPDFVLLNVAKFAPKSQRLTVLLNWFGKQSTVSVQSVTIPGTGTHNIEAHFPGDANYRQATSAPIPLAATAP